jgi:hypothetical protein
MGTEDGEDIIADWNIAADEAVDVRGDETEGLTVGDAVGIAAGMEDDGGTGEEENDGPEASGFHYDRTSSGD